MFVRLSRDVRKWGPAPTEKKKTDGRPKDHRNAKPNVVSHENQHQKISDAQLNSIQNCLYHVTLAENPRKIFTNFIFKNFGSSKSSKNPPFVSLIQFSPRKFSKIFQNFVLKLQIFTELSKYKIFNQLENIQKLWKNFRKFLKELSKNFGWTFEIFWKNFRIPRLITEGTRTIF